MKAPASDNNLVESALQGKTAPSPEPPPLSAGDLLAPGYRVVKHLRRGRALDVYDVRSLERDSRCVAKTLRPDHFDDDHAREMLLGEGRLLSRLSHPHIVRAYETVEEPLPMVILETLTGATLEYLIELRRFSVKDAAILGRHMCSAMHYLHHHGYLHLDLKPSNIVCEYRLAKVIDLSIARTPGQGRPGVGTRVYLSPEQARGDELGPPADVWGIGVVLFEALTGQRPFINHDPQVYEQLDHRAPAVRTLRRVPVALARAIDACLDPDPALRPKVDELACTFEGLILKHPPRRRL